MAFATNWPNKLDYIQYAELSVDEKMKFIVEQHGFELLKGDYVNGVYQLIKSSWYFKRLLSQMDVIDVIDEWYQFMGIWLCDHDSFERIYDDIQLGYDEDDRLLYYLIYMDLSIGGWARVASNHMNGWMEARQLMLDGIYQLHYDNVGENNDIIMDDDYLKCAKSHVEEMNWNGNGNKNDNEDDEYFDEYYDEYMNNELMKN